MSKKYPDLVEQLPRVRPYFEILAWLINMPPVLQGLDEIFCFGCRSSCN